ncbi:hypothetical protein HYV10_01615 [Candidatus Dependentiae bacterium]|nr:hypothetical protein [Candidatus Dependentiae bacterium]
MNRVLQFFLVFFMISSFNFIFSSNNSSNKYGNLRNGKFRNPLSQNDFVGTFYLNEETKIELFNSIGRMINDENYGSRTLSKLTLNSCLERLQMNDGTILFKFLEENNWKLSKESRDSLVNHYRQSYNKQQSLLGNKNRNHEEWINDRWGAVCEHLSDDKFRRSLAMYAKWNYDHSSQRRLPARPRYLNNFSDKHDSDNAWNDMLRAIEDKKSQ